MPVAEIIFAGVIATLAMTPFFRILRALGLSGPDLVEIIGALVSPRLGNARLWGYMLHFTFGIGWAFIYYAGVRAYGSEEPAAIMALCLGISFFHGLIVSFNLGNMVADHPHRKEVRSLSPAVAVVSLITHAVYGTALGAVFSALRA